MLRSCFTARVCSRRRNGGGALAAVTVAWIRKWRGVTCNAQPGNPNLRRGPWTAFRPPFHLHFARDDSRVGANLIAGGEGERHEAARESLHHWARLPGTVAGRSVAGG